MHLLLVLFYVGVDSCRAVAASVIRGSDSPPDCHSLPLLLFGLRPNPRGSAVKKKGIVCFFIKTFQMRVLCL